MNGMNTSDNHHFHPESASDRVARFKILFFDIDGTLRSLKSHTISPAVLSMLRTLQANGIKIVLSIGRSPKQVPDFDGIVFDALITFNGSLVQDQKGAVLFSNPISPDDVGIILANAAALHRPVALASAHGLSANGADKDLADYFAIADNVLNVDPDFTAFCLNETIYQIMAGAKKEEYPLLLQNTSSAQIAAWWDRAVDIIPKGEGKGAGVQAVLDHFQLSALQAAAFGDGGNDLAMLQAVGCGVAMGNAGQALKDAADEICLDVEDDGVVQWCLQHHLI